MTPSDNIPPHGLQDVVIRLLDIVISAIALLLVAPILLLIAALIVAEDGGPILFRQQRIGRSLSPFGINKFRTMNVEKTRVTGALQSNSRENIAEQRAKFVTTSAKDPRITKVGRILRPVHLDELPQLINVLVGDMSLVGVRPDVAVQEADYSPQQWVNRHVLRPGITGLAQVDSEVNSMKTRTARDLEWVRARNVSLYFRLLLLTFAKVIKRNSL